jgi:hypothetical protein
MARRNYKAEYRRRIARGLARGLSRSQARGHAQSKKKRQTKASRSKPDPRIDVAILEMNRGRSLTATAKALHISPKRLQKALREQGLGKRKGRRWVAVDSRRRRVPVVTAGRQRTLTVIGYEPARLVGAHHAAIGHFVRTNDITVLEPFEGKSVRAANGRKYPLETDPNELHRIAAMDDPPFHEIYQITSAN